MSDAKLTINKLAILSTKTILGYMVFLLSFFAIPAYKEAKALLTEKLNRPPEARIVIAETSIAAIVADTEETRELGLSGTDSLAAQRGMFFIFDAPDYHGIWMKDMNFAIDVIWLSESKEVIHIEQGITPKTYPEIFSPSRKALYILEVNAGFVKKTGIKIGDLAVIL
ncbi:MAG TPA: DUF192 domain-containing protein [Candidatus Paceibacterota bacterium]|nr:DUF192 domain-containing protein [Candidatus Paceibacterota bacterium]HRZ34628.1 DUF192 domain-containing protein [Candidatus Paceibacterota bacterium]